MTTQVSLTLAPINFAKKTLGSTVGPVVQSTIYFSPVVLSSQPIRDSLGNSQSRRAQLIMLSL